VTTRPDPSPYTIRAIQEMLGLSRGVITGLIASGFVAPSRGPRNEYRFTFREVVLLRTAVELQAARIPARKILASLRKLKATLPAELPLTGLRITAVGNDVTVRDGRSQWHAETGQLVMELLKSVAMKDNRSLIIVTHDARIFPFADRIARMDDGRIIAVETPADSASPQRGPT